MSLTSMKLSASEAKEYNTCSPSEGEGPAYPYGLCIYLDDDALQKLGITDLPDVGKRLTMMAVVEVTSNSQRQTQEGKSVSLDLQITEMALGAPVDDTPAQALYGKSKMNP